MDTLYPRCAGIDVHKNNVVVCVRCAGQAGKVVEQVRTFHEVREHDGTELGPLGCLIEPAPGA